jgi:sugar phosphate isomerase/epimerase
MKNEILSRRKFLQAAGVVLSAGALTSSFHFKKNKPLLSFSTLGCPDWTLKQIVDFASQHHFQGIEVRGILRQLDLPKCPEFGKDQIAATMRMMNDRDLKFVDLGSGATLHFPESAERRKNIDEGKRFIDLAHVLKCPYVRVFPNNFLKEQSKEETMDLIVKGLLELGDFAKRSNVMVLAETHGDLIRVDDLVKVMTAAKHEKVGLVWDVTNMWIKTKEPVSIAYERLKKYIRHTHIKNAKLVDGNIVYTRLKEGEVPIFEAIDLLLNGGFDGYYSFEWEKLWHPDLEAPELAMADYAQEMNRHFQL